MSLQVSEASATISLAVGEIASSDKALLAKTGRVLPTILGTLHSQIMHRLILCRITFQKKWILHLEQNLSTMATLRQRNPRKHGLFLTGTVEPCYKPLPMVVVCITE